MTDRIPVFVEGIEDEKKIVVEYKDFDSGSKEAADALIEYEKLESNAKNQGYEIVFTKTNKSLPRFFRKRK